MPDTREEILKQYRSRDGIIESPGPFEGEPIFAPYYWDLALEGFADETDGAVFTFNIDSADVEMWPELKETKMIQLTHNVQGFVFLTQDKPGLLDNM